MTGFPCFSYNIEGKITDCWLVKTERIFFLIFFPARAKLLTPDWPSAKNTRIWLDERESAPFAFCKRLETKSRFWIGFWVVQHKNIVSVFKCNRVGWQKWYGNRVIARREIPEGEPECFTGNSKWLLVLKLPKTLVNSASERSLRNSG